MYVYIYISVYTIYIYTVYAYIHTNVAILMGTIIVSMMNQWIGCYVYRKSYMGELVFLAGLSWNARLCWLRNLE